MKVKYCFVSGGSLQERIFDDKKDDNLNLITAADAFVDFLEYECSIDEPVIVKSIER